MIAHITYHRIVMDLLYSNISVLLSARFPTIQGWKRHASYCYFVGSETKTFDEAKKDCKTSGSYLADVSNGYVHFFNLLHPTYFTYCNEAQSHGRCVCVCMHFQGRQCIPDQLGGNETREVFLAGALQPEKHWWICVDQQRRSQIYSLEQWNARCVKKKNSAAIVNLRRDRKYSFQFPPTTQGNKQGCVAMTTGVFAGLWDLLPCTNKEKYICKHLAEGAVSTPEPPTVSPPKCPDGWNRVGTRNVCAKVRLESQYSCNTNQMREIIW